MFLRALLLLASVAFAPLALGADIAPLAQKEIDAIVQDFVTVHSDAFGRGDAAAMAAHLTKNAILQDEWGGITAGRDNIEALLAKVFAHIPKGTKFEDETLASISPAPGVIVTQGIARRLLPDQPPGESFFTRVLVLDDGSWKLAATEIARPSNVPKPGAAPATK